MAEPDSLRVNGSSADLDLPGVDELFAVIAYGEVAAFYRLTDEAKMAPDLESRIAIASMAASQMRHYEVLRDAMEARGIDVLKAMEPYVKTLESYHSLTLPRTWLEAMVKTYIGDSLAADFYREVVSSLPGESGAVLKAVLSTTGHSEFAIAQVQAAVKDNAQQRNRLTLWGRRLLGEAITQAQHVLARHDELAELVMSGGTGLGNLNEFFDRLQRAHAERMTVLGLG
jgi:hypothetical protein